MTLENPQNTQSPDSKPCIKCTGLMWWMTLVIAVLAVPSFALVISAISPLRGLGEVIVFVLACWLCTYLGMKLMQRPPQ